MNVSKMTTADGVTYLVEEHDNGTRVELKVAPILIYDPQPEQVPVGTTIEIAMHAQDFDGELRGDVNRPVTFYVSGTPVDADIVDGALTLSIEFAARGKHLIRVVPSEINMEPFMVEVV